MQDHWTPDRLEAERVVRYAELRPCTNAFVDTYTPGSDQKENFTIIGPGVAEHPDQHVHISEPHGFNIGGARQPPGCTNSQHSHLTEEVFVVYRGTWAFRTGDESQDGEIILQPGDCISIPTNVFRGFENVGDDVGYLFAVLGGDDPGSVLWAPDVFTGAEQHGLVLLENSRLVDTTRGEAIPDGLSPMPPTTEAQVAAHDRLGSDALVTIVATVDEQRASEGSRLTNDAAGVREFPVIGEAREGEAIAAGKLAWTHGFHLRRLEIDAGAAIGAHHRAEKEVLFVFEGELTVDSDAGSLRLGSGDVMTVPEDMERSFSNHGESTAVVFVVRGGDQPSAPVFHLAGAETAAH